MRRALHLARRGRHTHPNPMVGAVVVRDGRIVGEGWHEGVGTPHAEAAAFAAAGDAARGATLYVTLEPCSFTHRPDGTLRIPCAARCIDAGVRRVVAAMEDPDARVAGTGFARLRDAGIDVTVGIEEARARELNYAYLHHRRTGLPFITHKAAMTLDGKIAASDRGSQWITGEKARLHVHRLRDRADALVVGVGTVLADDPSLTTRLPSGNGHDPQRVLIDSRLRTPPDAKAARAGTLILAAETSDNEVRQRAEVLRATGAEVMFLPSEAGGQRVDVKAAVGLLASRGLLDVLLESGGALASSFWAAGLVSRALFFVAPKIIGGAEAPTPIDGAGVGFSLGQATLLGTLSVRRFGPDIALEANVIGEEQGKDVHRNH